MIEKSIHLYKQHIFSFLWCNQNSPMISSDLIFYCGSPFPQRQCLMERFSRRLIIHTPMIHRVWTKIGNPRDSILHCHGIPCFVVFLGLASYFGFVCCLQSITMLEWVFTTVYGLPCWESIAKSTYSELICEHACVTMDHGNSIASIICWSLLEPIWVSRYVKQ